MTVAGTNPRHIIEVHYRRLPKEFVYDGTIGVFQENDPSRSLVTLFSRKDLQDVAESLHHMIRYLSSCGIEFCVRLEQKAPGSLRRGVCDELTVMQVNQIFESVESARAFLAPTHQRRDMTDGKATVQ